MFMILIMILRTVVIFCISTKSTSAMHDVAAYKVLRSPILFFDSNPSGRITARFSKDISMLDRALPMFASMVAHCLFRSFFILITICLINPWLMIPVAIGLILLMYYEKVGVPTTIDCKRLDVVVRAPVHTTLTMLVNGLVTLRAHKKIDYFKKDFLINVDKGADVTFCFAAASRWMNTRFDMVCSIFAISTTFFCLMSRKTVPTELLAVSL